MVCDQICLKFYQNDHHTKNHPIKFLIQFCQRMPLKKKTPQFIKGKPWLNWGGNKIHKDSHNKDQSNWEWPTTKCHSKIVVFDQLCSRLGVIDHLDEEKIVKEYEQLKQNRSHLIFNIQIVMGINPKILGYLQNPLGYLYLSFGFDEVFWDFWKHLKNQ